jgi:hypothetical protein
MPCCLQVICTWGFSPQPLSWLLFQDWFFEVAAAAAGRTATSSALPTVLRHSSCRSSTASCPLSGSSANDGGVARRTSGSSGTSSSRTPEVSSQSWPIRGRASVCWPSTDTRRVCTTGAKGVVGPTQPLATEWSDRFARLPETVVKLGYDGVPLTPAG